MSNYINKDFKVYFGYYLHLLTNWMHFKTFICQGVQACKNYLDILANWMNSKTFICQGVQACKNYI